jgi:serine/threonine protein kinase
VQATQEEIQLHRHLHHRNIVQYYGAKVETNVLRIFMELVPGGGCGLSVCVNSSADLFF